MQEANKSFPELPSIEPGIYEEVAKRYMRLNYLRSSCDDLLEKKAAIGPTNKQRVASIQDDINQRLSTISNMSVNDLASLSSNPYDSNDPVWPKIAVPPDYENNLIEIGKGCCNFMISYYLDKAFSNIRTDKGNNQQISRGVGETQILLADHGQAPNAALVNVEIQRNGMFRLHGMWPSGKDVYTDWADANSSEGCSSPVSEKETGGIAGAW